MKNRLLLIGATAILTASTPFTGNSQVLFSDNFNDGNDTGWTRLSGFALSTGQTWDASSGAYRLTAPANGYNPGSGSYGFVGSVPTGMTLSDGMVQADVVAFQGGGPTVSAFGAFGVAARLNNLTLPLQMTGYAVVYEPYGNSSGPTLRLERLGPPSTFNSLGSVNVNLTPGVQYTMTLQTVGSSIVGSIWDLGQVGGSTPLGQIIRTDATYASGSFGFLEVNQVPMAPLDTTWDNFVTFIPEPGTGTLALLGLAGLLISRRKA